MLFDDNITFLSFVNLDDNKYNSNILNSEEGFTIGNMFKNEYEPYKNYKPGVLKTNSEKLAELYKIMELSFAINDLNLYLDLNPQDEKVFNLLKSYLEKLCEYEKKYVKKYGPLEIAENTSYENEWIKNPWPWDKEGSSYV